MDGETLILEQSNIKTNSISIYSITKRIFDLICAVIGLLFLLPVAVVIKISYVLNKDFNSIFYTHNRVGLNGKVFKLYKFRSMVPNADEVLKKLLKEDKKAAEEWEKYQKLSNDPRITKMGKIIRKLSLDELPQFIKAYCC